MLVHAELLGSITTKDLYIFSKLVLATKLSCLVIDCLGLLIFTKSGTSKTSDIFMPCCIYFIFIGGGKFQKTFFNRYFGRSDKFFPLLHFSCFKILTSLTTLLEELFLFYILYALRFFLTFCFL